MNSPFFAKANVIVCVALIETPQIFPVSASRPDGTSTLNTGCPLSLIAWTALLT